MDAAGKRERQRAKLEALRAKGKRHFILWQGVVAWGLSVALLFSLAMSWWDDRKGFMDWFPISVVVFPLGGWLWGAWMWAWMEKQWQRLERGRAE